MNKKRQEEQRRQEDLALKHGMLWAAGAVVLEVLLFLVNRYAFHFDVSAQGVAIAGAVRSMLRAMRFVGAAAALCGIALFVMQARKGGKTIWATVAAVAGAVLMTCAYVTVKYQATGMRMLYLLVPVLGGLALSCCIYQREFFISALSAVLAELGLWFVRVSGMGVEVLATVLVCVAVLVFVLVMKRNNGALKLGKTTLTLPVEQANYTMLLGSCTAAVAVQMLAAVAGGAVAYYLIFAMAAWLFALLVYYTVKLL